VFGLIHSPPSIIQKKNWTDVQKRVFHRAVTAIIHKYAAMKLSSSIIPISSAILGFAGTVSGFSSLVSVCKRPSSTTLIAERPFTSSQIYQYATAPEGLVNVADIWSERDVYSMELWATQYGMQKADGVELYSEDGGNDYSLMTNSGLAAGETVLWVPASIVINSASVEQEFGVGCLQEVSRIQSNQICVEN
jgi:hypothetical protein